MTNTIFISVLIFSSRKTPIDLVKENIEFWEQNKSGIHIGRMKEQLIEIHDQIKIAMVEAKTMTIESKKSTCYIQIHICLHCIMLTVCMLRYKFLSLQKNKLYDFPTNILQVR